MVGGNRCMSIIMVDWQAKFLSFVFATNNPCLNQTVFIDKLILEPSPACREHKISGNVSQSFNPKRKGLSISVKPFVWIRVSYLPVNVSNPLSLLLAGPKLSILFPCVGCQTGILSQVSPVVNKKAASPASD